MKRFMQELAARGIIEMRNVSGTANPTDALTKHNAPKSVFREYISSGRGALHRAASRAGAHCAAT